MSTKYYISSIYVKYTLLFSLEIELNEQRSTVTKTAKLGQVCCLLLPTWPRVSLPDERAEGEPTAHIR